MASELLERSLGSPLVAGSFRRVSRGWLRAIAYHDVSDADAFERHLEHLVTRYRPVAGDAVAAAVRGEVELPRDAVWVTFDDGLPGVVRNALPLLGRWGVPATMFVCPAVIGTTTPFWWQILDAALDAGDGVDHQGRRWRDRTVVTAIKRCSDRERREVVAATAERLADADIAVSAIQLTSRQLAQWRDAGHTVGNHTWDHPCLDTCTEDDQRSQVDRAHEWLESWMEGDALLFAYPNGNLAPAATRRLVDLGYGVLAGFDHRVAARPGRQVSRLRLDADAAVPRARAVVSGAHPALFQLASDVRRRTRASGR